ncbi:piggyBac transposable element-derived protein 3-like [Palaemon carinicauda]|uniref:piggyBac transposable element-derived protein 3-like n=1 Tax=Palaemon carinicauda TaxID=392227 RepID=UPI0035B684DD
MYWSETPDVFNDFVSESIRRDTFDKILRSLHFADNMKMIDDRFYKVRPFSQHHNNVSNLQFQQEFHSIDEIMIPYCGKHGVKQFIRGKPVRFGFKVWVACTSDGSLLYFEPYCGSDTKIPDIGLGEGPNVVYQRTNGEPLKDDIL